MYMGTCSHDVLVFENTRMTQDLCNAITCFWANRRIPHIMYKRDIKNLFKLEISQLKGNQA